MSDSFSDAYRPDNRPKGFGWWPEKKQRKYVLKLWEKGDRDEWLLVKMLMYGLITLEESRAIIEADPELREKYGF